MMQQSVDLVRVATGSLVEVQAWIELIRAAEIEARLVGDDLIAGLGTALPGTVELWVHRADAASAEAALAEFGRRRREPETHPIPPHGHPESDPKPDHSRGPQHGTPPHRPLPS